VRLRAGLAAASVAACSAVPAGTAPPAPARVQVVADEFTLTPSRLKLKAGPAIVELSNFGEDPHDLRFQRAGGTRVYGIKTTPPGDDTDLSVKLLPGRYTLWCSIADHRKRGMQATLIVLKATK
jgi:plastocyanin